MATKSITKNYGNGSGMDNEPTHVATLDLGTNTFKLVISEVDHPFPPIYRAETGVFIGKGGLQNKTILPEAILRAQKVLKQYADTIKKFNVRHAKAVATEAIRNAKNGDLILGELDINIPFTIDKITGKREAELTWSGVAASGLLSDKSTMIIDIGGASSEVIFANNKKINWLKSYKVGVSRALESFPVSDLPTKKELAALQAYFVKNTSDLKLEIEKHQPEILIGTAGSFDTWRKILEPPDKMALPFYQFKTDNLITIINQINLTPYSKRTNIKGIPEIRRESIVPAGLLVQYLLDIYNFNAVYQCDYSLAEGLMNEIINQQK